jgi:hypothetical protein
MVEWWKDGEKPQCKLKSAKCKVRRRVQGGKGRKDGMVE